MPTQLQIFSFPSLRETRSVLNNFQAHKIWISRVEFHSADPICVLLAFRYCFLNNRWMAALHYNCVGWFRAIFRNNVQTSVDIEIKICCSTVTQPKTRNETIFVGNPPRKSSARSFAQGASGPRCYELSITNWMRAPMPMWCELSTKYLLSVWLLLFQVASSFLVQQRAQNSK